MREKIEVKLFGVPTDDSGKIAGKNIDKESKQARTAVTQRSFEDDGRKLETHIQEDD